MVGRLTRTEGGRDRFWPHPPIEFHSSGWPAGTGRSGSSSSRGRWASRSRHCGSGIGSLMVGRICRWARVGCRCPDRLPGRILPLVRFSRCRSGCVLIAPRSRSRRGSTPSSSITSRPRPSSGERGRARRARSMATRIRWRTGATRGGGPGSWSLPGAGGMKLVGVGTGPANVCLADRADAVAVRVRSHNAPVRQRSLRPHRPAGGGTAPAALVEHDARRPPRVDRAARPRRRVEESGGAA